MIIAIKVTASHTGLRALGYEEFPLIVACVLMLLAAFINYYTYNVPTTLSLAGILSGWGVALLLGIEYLKPTGGGVASVLVSMTLATAVLIPFYVIGLLGAGSVKMQAAYGTWVGCAYPVSKAAIVTGITTIGGILLTIVVGLLFLLGKRMFRSDKTMEAVLPAQVMLSIGTIAALVVALKYMQ